MKTRIIHTMRALFITCVLIFCSAISVSAAEDLPYEVAPESRYYESAWGFGSGRYATVSDNNPYTNIPCAAGIDGYAFLSENGNILLADYFPGEYDITIPSAPNGTVQTWVHFHTASYRNGWTHRDNLTLRVDSDPDYQQQYTPEEVVENIAATISEGENVVLVLDDSGSMSDNQKEVFELLDTIDLSNTTLIVFAETYKVITPEELACGNYYVGGGTLLYPALNYAASLHPSDLILVSDLCSSFDSDALLDLQEFNANVTVYDTDIDDWHDEFAMDTMRNAWPNSTIVWHLIE